MTNKSIFFEQPDPTVDEFGEQIILEHGWEDDPTPEEKKFLESLESDPDLLAADSEG